MCWSGRRWKNWKLFLHSCTELYIAPCLLMCTSFIQLSCLPISIVNKLEVTCYCSAYRLKTPSVLSGVVTSTDFEAQLKWPFEWHLVRPGVRLCRGSSSACCLVWEWVVILSSGKGRWMSLQWVGTICRAIRQPALITLCQVISVSYCLPGK